jgi:5'-3' exonuclease
MRASGIDGDRCSDHDHEAGDVLASSAALAGRGGWRTVLVTSDRDAFAFALLDSSTSVLRVRNSGLDQAVLVTTPSW